jgi:hypothetical protein
MVITPQQVYLRLPGSLTSKLPGGKPWLAIDLGKLQRLGLGLSSFANAASVDPSQFLRYLRAASGKVTRVGTEKVRGVETTHYQATLDLGHYPALVSAAQREQARLGVAALEQLGAPSKLPVDVWIDGQHLVRRESYSMSETPTGSGPFTVEGTIDLYDYGKAPPITPPSADQVQTVTNATSG